MENVEEWQKLLHGWNFRYLGSMWNAVSGDGTRGDMSPDKCDIASSAHSFQQCPNLIHTISESGVGTSGGGDFFNTVDNS